MRTVIRKWFWAWEMDKEEAWLAECAAKGLSLVAVDFCKYTFEETAPGAYQVRLEMLPESPRHPESRKYLEFLEETGAEYIGYVNRWVYVRRKSELGAFDLFSDLSSRAKHLGRILSLLRVLMIFNAGAGIYNLCIGIGFPSTVNIVCGCISLAVMGLLLYGYRKVDKVQKALKREQQVFE
ncbi:MAG: DUF2812 domain-containing protein [Clostridia bacterium]|nr:DUF2812 domain-containing protein [Lachnospiraceae bacterium]MBQ8576557.1 DUF2812 domain-containing protein [Clostridia bacterium]